MLEAIDRWEGTPHSGKIRIAGKGVDCIGLVAAILVESGIIPHDTRLPTYKRQQGVGLPFNVATHLIPMTLYVEEDTGKDQQFSGSIAVFPAGRQTNHIGIIQGDSVFHVREGETATRTPLEEVEFESTFRIVRTGLKMDPGTIQLPKIIREKLDGRK